MKIKVNKFLENGAEILACAVVGAIFTKSAEYAGILDESVQTFTFSALGIGMLGGFFGLVIAKWYIADLRAKQTEDSFLQFEPKKQKNKRK